MFLFFSNGFTTLKGKNINMYIIEKNVKHEFLIF
jgi:hypothetical protein